MLQTLHKIERSQVLNSIYY